MYLSIEKAASSQKPLILAGAVGFEPTTKVLETHVLPLHHAPKHFFSISWVYAFVNAFFKLLKIPVFSDLFFPVDKRFV